MGNGAKANQKRERNQAKSQVKKGSQSQLKVNAAAANVICQVCRTSFLQTVREKALSEHAINKHSKSLKDCFPDWTPA